MTSVLTIVEAKGGLIQSLTYERLAAARQIAEATGASVEALALGSAAVNAAPSLGAADAALTIVHSALETYNPEAYLVALEAAVAARNPVAVVLTYDTMGLDLASALAIRLDRPLIAYVTGMKVSAVAIEAESTVYGGKLRAVSSASLPAVVVIAPGAFAEATGTRSPEVTALPPPPALDGLRVRLVGETLPDPNALDITGADKIVCVGRGIKDKENIEAARELAATLGAELAGSRPIIDNGWLPRERQVGKSGRKVKPKLYLALGVSGAPEHLEGMSSSELIVAVNTDSGAPIFGTAHIGATCDILDLIPALSSRLRAGGAV
jgi:electron transfer flavoprotein alpha subunit